jgi:enediyne biosynthesis protein E4
VSRLYKNNRDGTFTDVTIEGGHGAHRLGPGLLRGRLQQRRPRRSVRQLLGRLRAVAQPEGNGKFTDVARKAGVTTDPGNGQHRWNTGCAFLDYDKDGHLDLFVANYIDFDPKTTPLPESGPCLFKGIMVACGPPGLQGGKNILFHNNGDGTFKRCQPRRPAF